MHIAINGLLLREKNVGTNWYTYYLLKYLARIDNKNRYTVFLVAGFEFREISEAGNFSIYRFPKCFKIPLLRVLLEQFCLPFLIKRLKVDIYHSPSFVLPVIFRVQCKTVITVHDMVWELFPEIYPRMRLIYYKGFFHRSIEIADGVIAVTKAISEDILRVTKINRDRLFVVCSGSDPYFRILSNVNKDDYILFVGTIQPRKNIKNLIKAFYRVTKLYPEMKLVLVGQIGWAVDEVFESIRRLKLQEKVIFTGYISRKQMLLYYNKALVAVFPSLYEGFGLGPVEALGCGTPVVVSNIPAHLEVLGEAGVYVDPYNPDDIADGIIRLIEDKELYARQQRLGLERVKRFSWEETARGTLEVYRQVLSEEKRR